MSKKEVIIDGILIFLERKNIKHMYLKVKPPNGDVHISAPIYMSDKNIVDFVKSKKEWIISKQNYINDNNIKVPLKYTDGEEHPLWGEKYKLKLTSANKILINKKESIIYLPYKNTIGKRKNLLDELYRNELKKALPKVLNKCTNIVGHKPTGINVRKMKNWGNCKQDGRITLNINLAKKPAICLEYVLIHELCHLIEFNHSKNFKMLMDKFCPNWREIKKILNEKD